MTRRLVMGSLLGVILTCLGGEPLFQQDAALRTDRVVELTAAAVPIPHGQKVRLAFSASTDSRYTIEADERIRLLDLSRVASRVRLEFHDGQGTLVAGGIEVCILTQAHHDYVRIFYPPSQAIAFRLFVQPAAGAEVVIQGLSVGTDLPHTEVDILNPHPTFEHGDLNLYGCQSGFGGQFYTRPDGRTVWKTGFLGYSPSFPVEAGRFYTIHCRAKAYRGRKSYLLLDCYNETDRAPIKSMRVEMSSDGRTTELQMPAGAVSARLRCYCVILEEFRVTTTPQAPPHD